MDGGVLSACNDSCRSLHTRLAEKIAQTDAAKISTTSDLELVVVDSEVWRTQRDQPMELIPPAEVFATAQVKQSRAIVAGRFILATLDNHGQLYDSIGARSGTDLLAWDPGEAVQLDEHTFLITDRSEPRFGVFDVTTGRKLWEHDLLVGFTIADAVRLRDGAGALLLLDDAGWWIATVTNERKILALEHVPLCR